MMRLFCGGARDRQRDILFPCEAARGRIVMGQGCAGPQSTGGPMSDKMVLLAIYGNPIEAELVRAELEAEGIRACVMGATSGDVFAGMGVGMSNVQLLVPETDYKRATRLLAEESDVAREARRNRGRKRRRRKKPSAAIKTEGPADSSPTEIRPAAESPV